jgi:hypothetical protein
VGFGAVATGGRGGTVYHVTNLNDTGTGSFRDAVSKSGRVVVFDVGGYVQLASAVSVKSNITIAGQTAPGGGIGFMAREVSFSNSSNVIVRDVRFRQGDLDPFANAHNRCPLAKANTQYINNVVYDYQAGYTAGNSSGHFSHDVVGNYFITGPRTTSASNAYYQMGNQSVYNSGNLLDSNRDGRLNGATLGVGGGGTALSGPWSPATATIPATSAATAYTNVLAKAGAFPRDQVDAQVVSDVASLGTAGNLWTHQTDTDRDGLPDAWELRYGLNPNSAADATGDFDHTGYTNVEKYVNGLIDGQYR